MIADEVTIQGNYTLFNLIKHTSGHFSIKVKNLTYQQEDVFYVHDEDTEVDMVASESRLSYNGISETSYENIGLFTQLFEGVISKQLTEDVLARVKTEIQHKIRYFVTSKIRRVLQRNNKSNETNQIEEIVKSILSDGRMSLQQENTLKLDIEEIRKQVEYATSPLSCTSLDMYIYKRIILTTFALFHLTLLQPIP